MEKEFIAYTAGFFDGDGHIVIDRRKTHVGTVAYSMRVVLSQANEPALRELRSIYDDIGSLYSHSTYPHNFNWQITGQQAEMFLRTLLPYLRIKKAQAEIALKFRETFTSKGGTWNRDNGGWGGRGGRVPLEVVAQREQCRQDLAALRAKKHHN